MWVCWAVRCVRAWTDSYVECLCLQEWWRNGGSPRPQQQRPTLFRNPQLDSPRNRKWVRSQQPQEVAVYCASTVSYGNTLYMARGYRKIAVLLMLILIHIKYWLWGSVLQLFKQAEQAEESELAIPVDGYSSGTVNTSHSDHLFPPLPLLRTNGLAHSSPTLVRGERSFDVAYSKSIPCADALVFGEELDYPLFYISPTIEMSDKPMLQVYNLQVSQGKNPRWGYSVWIHVSTVARIFTL